MQIAEVELASGTVGICAMPGRSGHYAGDLTRILEWAPTLVVTLAESGELAARGAASLSADLGAARIAWLHLPIPDFGTPPRGLRGRWAAVSRDLRVALHDGRVLVHCMGGCGRSGMIVLRLMGDEGEPPETALIRLRAARACAVETKAQLRWATGA